MTGRTWWQTSWCVGGYGRWGIETLEPIYAATSWGAKRKARKLLPGLRRAKAVRVPDRVVFH